MLEIDKDQYNTDKIENRYLERYADILQPWVDLEINMLELGIFNGGSLLLWRDYFPKGTITGVDINLPDGFSAPDRVQLFQGSQADPAFLTEVAQKTAPEGYDIIIDDASHIGRLTKIAFWHLFENHLKPGGLYIIEDWGTGYWPDWPDGGRFDLDRLSPQARDHNPRRLNVMRYLDRLRLRWPMRSHAHGMVGFIKQLVDEQGAHDATRRRLATPGAGRPSKFEKMIVMPSIVVIQKSVQR